MTTILPNWPGPLPSIAGPFFISGVPMTKPVVDEITATLIEEALISIESASAGLEAVIARRGDTPGLAEVSRRLALVKDALTDLSDFIKPEAATDGQ